MFLAKEMICRVCLKGSECPLKIFDVNGEQLGIAKIVQQHFWFTPQPNDTISTVICRTCWVKVNDFHEFYKVVEQAHLALTEQRTLASSDHVKGELEGVESKQLLMTSEVNIKEELLENVWPEATNEEDPTAALYEQELETVLTERVGELNMQSKLLEDVEEVNIERKPLEDEEEEVEKMQVEETKLDDDLGTCGPVTRRRRRADTTTRKPAKKLTAAKKRTVAKRLTATKLTTAKELTKADNDEVVAKPLKVKRPPHKMITPHDDEIVKKHIPMGCDLCTFVGVDFSAMSEHFRLQHEQLKPYIMCCGRKLNKRFKIVQHAYKHEDPDFFRCQHCQKSFSNGYTLRNHMTAAHAPEEDLTYACDKCEKKFSRKYLLDLHTPSHIPINERKFVCEKCPQSKPFASDHLLQIHISMRHKKAVNVCHVCAKEIRDKQSFEKHVRLHFEDSGPRVKCPQPNCDRWLKDEDNLRQHMRRHRDEGKIFACSECGKVCKNRRALTSHFGYAHSSEVFACDECKKTFKKAITLKEHMAQHTGESLYKCPFCTRTFNSNANMHSHKKKMHPVEWDIWRKTKRGSSQKIISGRFGSNGISSSSAIGGNVYQA